MKAIIFAAGLGTRIQSVSQGKPKALVEINKQTLLSLAIDYLYRNGVEQLIVNVHHRADLMKAYIGNQKWPINVEISDESDLLLDTAGGLIKAKSFFNGESDFVAYNVDILTDLDLKAMYKKHCQDKNLATLAVRERNTSRYFLQNERNQIRGWENAQTGVRIAPSGIDLKRVAFSGIHIISTKIFDFLPQNPMPLSITKSYIELAKDQHIGSFLHPDGFWFDVGKPETYAEAKQFLRNR